MSKKIEKALSKMTRQQQLSELMFRLQDFTENYWGEDYDTDTCMATDISYLRGIIGELHGKNVSSLERHVNIASQCINLRAKPPVPDSLDTLNPFA
jgi:hypothetical protein